MNWEVAGAVAEIVGALAVILTLGYLAIQVRQGNLAMRVAAKQEMTRQFADMTDLLLGNPELFDMFDRIIMKNGAPQTELEASQLSMVLVKATWYFSSMHFQFTTHTLSSTEWHQSKSLIRFYCRCQAYQSWWPANRGGFPEEFASFIESQWD
ncbi:MAG: hypothetical protein ACI9W1_002681 [Candidatus Azotimanducaceae bacterium]|jgi:hypothetical protein